ncbi:toll/interleukin-1 receptor domain-containing protein [Streptomyces sp. NPDC101209]|uniref:toll/interleukin-1 receptor domain-containing protein n=1 Tax=Streptomyces sp. NPDC101209 TaxID=3366129 RepID=UPI00381D736B
MTGVFINYRTGDGEKEAVVIDNELRRVFGDDNVFRDRRAMKPGTHFPQELKRRLETSSVVLVLIGRNWLKATDGSGNRRIDDPTDYVHYEIRRALGLGKTVVPLLLDGAPLPRWDELPTAIARLAEQQISQLAITYAHEQMDPIVKFLKSHVQPLPPGRPATREQQRSHGAKYHIKQERGAAGDHPTYIENNYGPGNGDLPGDGPDGRPA